MENKRKLLQWNSADMDAAVSAIKSGKLTLREAQNKYKVPKSTLQRKVKGNTRPIGRQTLLTKDDERNLVKTILYLETKGFGLSKADIQKFAYAYVEANGLPNKFNHQKREAGKNWFYCFLKRHPEINMKKSEVNWLHCRRCFRRFNNTKKQICCDRCIDQK